LRISRRNFLKLFVGGAAVATGASAWLLGTPSGRTAAGSVLPSAAPVASKVISFKANGLEQELSVAANSTLLDVLRKDLKLTGTRPGCSNSECGACTVLMDGVPVYSCHKLAIEADGHQITTIEGISSGSELSPLQQAFIDEGGFQCGYCTAGVIVTATALLKSTPKPTASEVSQALSGNICRCGSYPHMVNAVLAAAQEG